MAALGEGRREPGRAGWRRALSSLTSSGMSSTRSRSGGISMGKTLSR